MDIVNLKKFTSNLFIYFILYIEHQDGNIQKS